METEQTSLRQAEAIVRVTGLVAENKLEQKKDKEGKDIITGQLSIKVDDVTTIPIRAYAKAKTKDGNDNSVYKGLKTVIDTYKSIADVGEEEATKVRVSKGQLGHNMFVTKTGQVVEDYQLSSNFFTSDPKNYEPKKEFEVELFVKNVRDEVVKGEPTGRAIIDGVLVMYQGEVAPITLVANEDLAEDVKSEVSSGETRRFYGEIVNTAKEIKKEVHVAIGKPRTETTYEYKKELVITNVTEAYDDTKAYPLETIKSAYAEYCTKKENLEKAIVETPATSGREFSTPKASTRPAPKF